MKSSSPVGRPGPPGPGPLNRLRRRRPRQQIRPSNLERHSYRYPVARDGGGGRPWLRSPHGSCPDAPGAARRGQRPVAGLPLPGRRHRDQHPAQVRDDLDADDLRTADLPDAGPPGSTLVAIAVAGHSGRAAGARRRPTGRAATPALHQDAYAARRHSFRRPGHVRRNRPASGRCVRVGVPPRPTDRALVGTAATRPASSRAPWTLRARWRSPLAARITPASRATADAARAHTSSTASCAAGPGRVT